MSHEPTIESRGRLPAPPKRRPVGGNTVAAGRTVPPPRTTPAVSRSLPAPTTVTTVANNTGPRLPARYRVVRELGRGGMGVVLLAEDTEFNRLVAIKLLLPGRTSAEGIARFVREAKVTGQLEHPSIMPVHELLQLDDGTWAMVMKFVEGESLRDRLTAHAKGKPFPLHEKLEIMRRVCDAVGYMHSRGFLHRDIKPDNILVGRHGEVVVADLGIARRMDDDEEQPEQADVSALDLQELHRKPQRTLDGKILGTPAYMSPEQASGRISELGPETDVFAIGAVLYALLTHTPPYTGRDAMTVLRAAQQGEFLAPSRRIATSKRPLPAISTDLEAVVLKAMEHDAHHRYANALQLGDDLARVANNELVTARRYGVLARAGKWVQRNPGHASAAAALVFCLMTVGILGALTMNGIAAAEAEKAREATARARAEQQAERAKVEAALREGQVEKLSAEMGVEVTRANLAALQRFEGRSTAALDHGGEGFGMHVMPNDELEALLADVGRARRMEQATGKRILTGHDFFTLGQIYTYALRQPDRALAYFDEACNRDQTLAASWAMHWQRGMAMMEARHAAEKVLPLLLKAREDVEPTNSAVRTLDANIGATYHDLRDFDKAATYYRAALTHYPAGAARDRLLALLQKAEQRLPR